MRLQIDFLLLVFHLECYPDLSDCKFKQHSFILTLHCPSILRRFFLEDKHVLNEGRKVPAGSEVESGSPAGSVVGGGAQ